VDTLWRDSHNGSRMHLMAKPRTGMVEVLISHTTDLSEFHEYIGTVIERWKFNRN